MDGEQAHDSDSLTKAADETSGKGQRARAGPGRGAQGPSCSGGRGEGVVVEAMEGVEGFNKALVEWQGGLRLPV